MKERNTEEEKREDLLSSLKDSSMANENRSSLDNAEYFLKTNEEIEKAMSLINKSAKLCDKNINGNFTLTSINSSLSKEHILVDCENVLDYE